MLIKEFFEDVLKLPYKPNFLDNPKHEYQVRDLLIEHGFTLVLKDDIDNGYIPKHGDFVSQPNGTQNSPDFPCVL